MFILDIWNKHIYILTHTHAHKHTPMALIQAEGMDLVQMKDTELKEG